MLGDHGRLFDGLRGVAVVPHRDGDQAGSDAGELAHRRRRVRGELTAVRQPRDRLGDARVHAPRAREEVAVLGRDDIGAVHDPAERRRVDRLGVRPLAHLRQLLRVAEQQQARGRERDGDRRGERELAGLVDHEQVEALARDARVVREVPRRASDHVPGVGVLGGERGHAVLRDRR